MSGATRPMRISELLNKLPAWCRQAVARADQRPGAAPAAPADSQNGPVDPASLPLPPALQGRVSAVREGDTLMVSAATSAAAQILRFHGPRLAQAAGVARCHVRVAARSGAPARQQAPAPGPALPAAAAPMLEELAANCDHDRLSQALKRLAAQASED